MSPLKSIPSKKDLDFFSRKAAKSAKKIVMPSANQRHLLKQFCVGIYAPTYNCCTFPTVKPARRAWVYFFSPPQRKEIRKNSSASSVSLMSGANPAQSAGQVGGEKIFFFNYSKSRVCPALRNRQGDEYNPTLLQNLPPLPSWE